MLLKVIFLVILAFLFFPFKLKIYLEDGKNIVVYFSLFKFAIKNKVNSKEEVEESIANGIVNFLDNKKKMLLLKKIYSSLDFKEIDMSFGTNNPVVTTAIFSFFNVYFASNKMFLKTKINMDMFYTEKTYKFKIKCIFKITLAKTIYILLKERWSNVWKNIQFTT